LCLLAAAAAVVSFTAQYRMVDAVRRLAVVAGLEAAIPDGAALVFACLGIALALQGRRAIRARVLNIASIGTSVFMNAIAAAPGWRNLAIWAMPPVAYALASDTLIGVVRPGWRPDYEQSNRPTAHPPSATLSASRPSMVTHFVRLNQGLTGTSGWRPSHDPRECGHQPQPRRERRCRVANSASKP
jgi:hypothetical protein